MAQPAISYAFELADGQRSKRVGARILILALVVSTSAFASPPPNPVVPFDLPGESAHYPAAGDQKDPTVARGGDMYLTAWTDVRTSFFDASGKAGSGRDVYAARLDADGNLIDTTPIAINQDESDQYDPVVVWNGTNWLVLWTGTVPYGPAQQPTIEAVRVNPAGEILDPEPLLIWTGGTTRGTSGEHLFGAASDGNDWALVIVDQYVQGLGTKTRLVGRRITPDGDIIEAPYYLYSPACCYFFYKGGLAYADGIYMAVFEGYVSGSEYGIFGLRMSPTLTTLDSYPVVLTQIAMQGETRYYRTPQVAGKDDMFYVGWQLYVSGGGSQIYGARVNSLGQSLDGEGVPISDPGPLSLYLSPDLTWDGTQWIASWSAGNLRMARIDPLGNVLDPGGIGLGIGSGAMAGTGTGGLQFVRSEPTGAGPAPLDVFQTPISATLDRGADQCIGLGAPSQIRPDLAPGADGYLLTYRSDISAESRIMARPLDPNGSATTSEPVQLASGRVDLPRVAFDGSNYMVVWSDVDAGKVRGRRLSQAGSLLDVDDFTVLDGYAPDVAGMNDQFFVTASRAAGVHGARVAGDGNVIDSPPLLLGAGGNSGPRVASLGGFYLTAWEQTDAADGGEIALSAVNTTGLVIGPLDVTVPGDGLAHHRPAVAAGDSALIVWEDERAGNTDLYGRRISFELMFLDPASGIAITDAPSEQVQAAVAWDGARFLTVFADDRNVVNTLDMRTDIYRNWVTRFGIVEEPSGLSVYAESTPEIDPVVESLGTHSLYASARFTGTIPLAAYRIWLRYSALPSGLVDDTGHLPDAARLVSLYPNPANPAVKIRFALARSGVAQVDIYDLQGALVRTLRTANLAAGEHVLHWDGRDTSGRNSPSGAYLFRFQGGGVHESGKLVLVR